MTRSDALKKAQIKYRENHREKINEYFRNYERTNYTEKRKDKKAEYYKLNKEKIKEKQIVKNFDASVFTGFRKLMIGDYR